MREPFLGPCSDWRIPPEGAKTELIQKTIGDIKAIRPDHLVPTHCTGFEAISAFAREMPDQFILNTA